MSSEYIKPNLAKYITIDELSSLSSYFVLSHNKFDFDIIYKEKLCFIVGEPGFGKSRLLKEIVNSAEKNKLQSIYVDLKKVGQKKLDVYLPEVDEIYGKLTNENNNYKTEKFSLENKEDIIICLDALDEVSSNDFYTLVENIYEFIDTYSKVKVFISCRTNYINHWKSLLTKKDFKFIEVKGFDDDQLYKFFKNVGYEEDEIKQAKIYDNTLLRNPRYLEIYADAKDSEERKGLLSMSKGNFFRVYLSKELNTEGKKGEARNNNEIIIAFLQKLALIMEIYQTNSIKKEELIVFFDDIKSNLSSIFLSQVNINTLYERTLLKDNIDSIEFKNTELQEYLASCEMLKLGKLDQVVFDLVVHKKLHEINPSWINTLSFLLESNLSLLKPVLDFSLSGNSNAHAEDYYKLLPKYNTENLSGEEKIYIFSKVFLYYQEVGHWLDYDIAERLSYYYTPESYKLINNFVENKNTPSEQKKVVEANSATVIGYLAQRGLLKYGQRQQWVKKLLKYATSEDKFEVTRRRAIFALGEMGDIKLLNKIVTSVFASSNDSIFSNLIYACEKIDINHSVSVKCIAEGIKRNNISARIALLQITKKESLTKLLNYFLQDQNLLDEFLEHETIYDDETHQIVKNIEDVIDVSIINLMKRVLVKSFAEKFWYRSRESKLIISLARLLRKQDKDYAFELLAVANKQKNKDSVIYGLEDIFARLLEINQIEKFAQELNNNRYIADIIYKVIALNPQDTKQILKIGKKILPDEFKTTPTPQKTSEEMDADRHKQVYSTFKVKLQPTPEKYDPGVFRFYLDNKDILKTFIKPEDKKRLEDLIINSIFDKFDPGDQSLKITQHGPDSRTYTTHSWISIFGNAIKVASELKINVSKFRQKILNYIPFAYDNHLKAIFELIDHPTDQELAGVLKIYTQKRDDDLKIHLPASFISFCENYNFNKGKRILEFYMQSDNISIYDRNEALRVIAELGVNKTFLKKIYSQYRDEDGEQSLSIKANEYLISKFEDASAISWRFSEIKKKAFPFKRREGVHSIGIGEHEMSSNEFSKPLMNLKSPVYRKDFENLLLASFEILKQGDDFLEYASYIWNIIIQYYKNLTEISYHYIFDLNAMVLKFKNLDGINWFTYKIHEIKREYMGRQSRPENIAECIKKYNKLKEKTYLDVRSNEDFFQLVKEIIDQDLRKWIESGGAYKFINELSRKKIKKAPEDLIQKTIKTQFENFLMKKGLRGEEISIYRESQLLDDKRTDFLISYGFLGTILIEIKLTTNHELDNDKNRKAYRKKLLQYLEGTESPHGIFLILQNNQKRTLDSYLPQVKKLYIKDPIEVIGLNCQVVDEEGI